MIKQISESLTLQDIVICLYGPQYLSDYLCTENSHKVPRCPGTSRLVSYPGLNYYGNKA